MDFHSSYFTCFILESGFSTGYRRYRYVGGIPAKDHELNYFKSGIRKDEGWWWVISAKQHITIDTIAVAYREFWKSSSIYLEEQTVRQQVE